MLLDILTLICIFITTILAILGSVLVACDLEQRITIYLLERKFKNVAREQRKSRRKI
jgi:hypothetical protein